MRKIIPFRDVQEAKDEKGALLARISFENEDYLEQVKGVNVYYDYDSFLSNYQSDLEQSGLPERRFLQHLSRAYEQAVSEIKYCVNYVYGQEITYTPNTHKKSNFTAEQLERIDDSLWVNGEMEAPILVTPNKKRIKIRLQTAFEDILNEIKEKSANISKSASEDDAQSLPQGTDNYSTPVPEEEQPEEEDGCDYKGLAGALSKYIRVEPDTYRKLKCYIKNGRLPNLAEDAKIEWTGTKADAGAFIRFLGGTRKGWIAAFSQPWEGDIKHGNFPKIVKGDIPDILESFGLTDQSDIK